ncbi:MAG: MarR family transcriptional regulator [Aquisalinus sp.]|nr:MarR family transcriptional regulator [Aquisalinus sp.]
MIAHMASVEFERLLPDGMTEAQFGVLNRLLRLDTVETISELADAFQVTQPTMSSTVKRLEEKGYIRFLADATDRRTKQVAVTAAGTDCRNEVVKMLEPHYAGLANDASRLSVANILPELQIIRGYLEKRKDGA